ncbi:phage tail spike protein [Leuconostoc mesenteroides]|uniref:phage tail spike protein n=1 Tax=Leuconostoc mesenteroides TaxID=1245 RepID=UPI002360EC5A|nr:phage tail spike protein [Leuconostoc mesenteroides]
MTPILYEKDEIDFTSQGLGSLVEIYDVDVQEQRNGLLQLTASYPVSGVRYADISVGRIILAKPNQRDDVHAFRIVSTELDISGYAVTIEADSITYDLTHNVVKHLVASGNGQSFMTALKNAVINPSIFAFYSDIATSSTTLLNYVNPMEAIMGTTGSFLQIWGGELKRENRRVAMFNRRGRDNVATFRLGKNILGLKYSVDISSLVTRIIPTKSVQNDDQTTTTLEGIPVDSQYINNYEQVYTLPLEFTDDTIKTVADLNAAAKGWFTKSANTGRDKPTVTIDIDVLSLQDSADYQDKFKNLESVSLTDTVTVYVPEYGVNVTAIVNELHYDPILDRVTKMTVGTAKQSFADSSRTQLSDLQDKIISVQNQADAVAVSANGKSTNYYGSVEPSHPQKGDAWYWVNGDKSGIKVFVNGDWVDLVDSDTQEKIAAGVTEAISQAKAHTDEVKQGLSRDISTAKSQAAVLANAAEANAKIEAVSQFNRAQSALSAAKTDLTNSIASEASERNRAVAAANSQAQTYANQAKADAMSAASSADSVIRTAISSSADSLSATISQNKSSADSGISTAQTTAQQAVDGLKFKVSQTDYNTKTGQLQTDLTTTTQTANQAKTDIVSIKQKDGDQDSRMNTIESDASGTKQTVSQLQTVQGQQSGSISTLQQRADGFEATVTKVNNLAVGGRNYVLNTNVSTTSNITGFYSSVPSSYFSNKKLTVSVQLDYDNITALSGLKRLGVEFVILNKDGSNRYIGYWKYPAIGDSFHGRIYTTFDFSNNEFKDYANNQMGQGIYVQGVIGTNVSVSKPKLEIGTITDWTPAPEDLSGAIAKVKITADDASAAVTKLTNADGIITKAQADIKANADAITEKVSKTVYDQKTGELLHNINEAKDTADGAVRTVGNYQTSNDKRVKAAESAISQNADAIALKVSKTDYDNNNSNLNTRFTKVEATADGASTTVSKLSTTVNNLGQINRLLNTEFNPDYASWTAYGNRTTLSIDRYWLQNGSNNLGVSRDQDQSNYGYAIQKIAIGQNTTFSFSVNAKINSMISSKGRLYIHLRALDANGNMISDIYKSGDKSTTNNFESFSIQNAQTPAGTTVVELAIGMYGGGSISFNHPFFVLDSHIGNYVAGNYSNSDYLAQVKITADSISNFVRDSSGNISSDFQTALSKTSIITGSTLATSIQKQTSSQIAFALTDNNGKIISLINQDASGVQIAGDNIILDGDTTVTGDFYAKGGNFKNLNASNLTVGTLNGNQVNITNINANNIVSGSISGANLSINLNTGSVVFQKGRINSSDYTTDINIDQGYISTANGVTRALLTQGKLQLIDPTFFSPQTNPYLEISNNSAGLNGMSALIKARDSLTVSINRYDDRGFDTPVSTETFVGLNIGKYNNKLMATKIGGAEQGVIISGGKQFTIEGYGDTPYIYVGSDSSGRSQNGDRVSIHASYFHSPSTYLRTTSGSANVVVKADGAIVRSSSARKYKLDIKNNIPIDDSLKLIEVPLSTWVDKHEHEENGSNERYFGMIAEDLRDAGLEYLVQYGEDNEVEGINYDRVALLLIPLVKELKERIEELESEGK